MQLPRIAKPKYLIWAAFIIVLVWFFNPFAEGFETSVESVEGRGEAGCPCRSSAGCKSLRCKGGRCADYLGNVPVEQPRGGCLGILPAERPSLEDSPYRVD